MRVKKLSLSGQNTVATWRWPFSASISILAVALLVSFFSACGQPSSGGGTAGPGMDATPQLTDEVIRERINDTRVWDVPPESGSGDTIVWNFDDDEPKEITVVERHQEETKATLVLDIKTSSNPRRRTQRHLAGQIRTEWRLQTGWALRRWEIVDTENISMKYTEVAKPAEQNSNR